MHPIRFLINLLLISGAIMLTVQWIRNPKGDYEPKTVLIGFLLLLSGLISKGIQWWKSRDSKADDEEDQPLQLPLESIPEPGNLSANSRVLFRPNDQFYGRNSEMLQMATALQKGSTVVVAGIPGQGKTSVAREFVYRYGPYFSGGVFWIDGSDPDAIVDQIARCGASMGLAEPNPDELARQAMREWQNPVHRLLVFDNCPHEDLLDLYAPKFGGCRVLVTTRKQNWPESQTVEVIGLQSLTKSESIRILELYSQRAANEGPTLELLAEKLEGLPLALHLAGSYLQKHPRVSVEEYLDLVMQGKHEEKLWPLFVQAFDELEPADEGKPKNVDDLALTLLARVTWWIWGSPLETDFLCRGCSGPVGQVDEAFDRLFELGLLEKMGAHVRIHQLFGDYMVRAIGEEPLREALTSWKRILTEASGKEQASGLEKRGFASQFWHIGNLLEQWGEVKQSDGCFLKAMEIWDQTMDPESLTYAVRLNHLGEVLFRRRQKPEDLRRASALFDKAVKIGDQTLGVEHHRVINWLENRAKAFEEIGRYKEAKDDYRRLLEYAQKYQNNAAIATSQSNLAMVLNDLGELEEAEKLLRAALASDEKSYQAGHPSIARSQSNLALVLKGLGGLEEAEKLLRSALASAEKSYQAGHPSIARSQSNLAMVLQDLGGLEEAEKLLRSALASDEKSYEARHPSVAIRQWNLAAVLKELEMLEEARDLIQKAHATLLQKLGPNHGHTHRVLSWLKSMNGSSNGGAPNSQDQE